MMQPKQHDFQERLKMSQKASDEPFWENVYSRAFVGYVGNLPVLGDSPAQRLGIDRFVVLSSGKELRIDEKKRETVYPDILLEYLSNDQTGAPGWVEKNLPIDYIAYAFMPVKRVHLYPWQQLRLAWVKYGPAWQKNYTKVPAKNDGYTTWSVAVPIAVLDDAIREASVIQLGSVKALGGDPEPVSIWTQTMITEFCREIKVSGHDVPTVIKSLFGGNLRSVNPVAARAKWSEYANKKAA